MLDEIETIVQRETFRVGVSLKLTEDDTSLVNAELVVFDEDNQIVITKTSPFAQNTETDEWEADLSTSDTDVEPGTYEYFVRINWDDDTNDIIPDQECVEDGDCSYPKLVVCEEPLQIVVS